MKALAAVLGGLLLAALPSTAALAATINYPPPPSGGNFQNVAADVPAMGNIWTGLGQSFTDQDPHIMFGFWVGNNTGSAVTGSLLFSLLYRRQWAVHQSYGPSHCKL